MTDLHISPGDALPDLLTGCNVTIEAYVGPDCGWIPCPMVDGHAGWALHADLPKRFDLTRPEALDHVARVLARGLRCPGCPECQPAVDAAGESDTVRMLLRTGACHDCGGLVRSVEDARRHEDGSACAEKAEAPEGEPVGHLTVVRTCPGSGYLRPPSPVWHLLDADRTSVLSRRHIAEAVGWSVRAGKALPAVYGPWTRWGSAGIPMGLVRYDRWCLAGTGPAVSYFGGKPERGSRPPWMLTRPEADAFVLRHWGRIDDGTLTLPELP